MDCSPAGRENACDRQQPAVPPSTTVSSPVTKGSVLPADSSHLTSTKLIVSEHNDLANNVLKIVNVFTLKMKDRAVDNNHDFTSAHLGEMDHGAAVSGQGDTMSGKAEKKPAPLTTCGSSKISACVPDDQVISVSVHTSHDSTDSVSTRENSERLDRNGERFPRKLQTAGNVSSDSDHESGEAVGGKVKKHVEEEIQDNCRLASDKDGGDVPGSRSEREDEQSDLVITNVFSLSGCGTFFDDNTEKESDARTQATAAGQSLRPDSDNNVKRNYSGSQAGGQETENDPTCQPKRRKVDVTCTESCSLGALSPQVSCTPSSSTALSMQTKHVVSCQAMTSVVYPTMSKPLTTIPIDLAMKDITKLLSSASDVNTEFDSKVTIKIKTSEDLDRLLNLKSVSLPKSVTTTPRDYSVQNASIDRGHSLLSQKTSSDVNPTKSVTTYVVAPNSSFPYSVENVIQSQGSKQRMSTTTHQTPSVLKPGSISLLVRTLKGNCASTELVTDNTKLARCSAQTSAHSLSSGLSLLASSDRPADCQVTKAPVVSSNTQHPAPSSANVTASQSVCVQEVNTVTSVVLNRVCTANQRRPICAVPLLSSVGKSTTLVASQTTPNHTQSASDNVSLGSRQDVRLDQASSETKMCAADMAVLIQGENLVPSLLPMQQPGRAGCNSSVYRCVECSALYSTLVGYTFHVKRISMVIRYACILCKAVLVFFNKCTFRAHLRKHATSSCEELKCYNVSSLPKELSLPVGRQFMDPMNVDRSQPVKCTECEELFPDASALAKHFGAEVMDCDFEHTCTYCKMVLPTSCALKAHERLHDDQCKNFCAREPYVCPECGLQFPNQSSLYQHMYATCLHFNRCFVPRCLFCRDVLPSLQTLEEHISECHSNEKRYMCGLCNRIYCSEKFFIEHIYKMHEDVNQPGMVPVKVVSSCAYGGGDLRGMQGQKHVNNKKRMSGSFTCLFCSKCVRVTRQELLVHLSQVHSAYRFTCCICQSGFVTVSLLRAHGLSAHCTRNAQNGEIGCGMCSTVLNRESALPHIMWHVIQKFGKADEAADSVVTAVSRYPMEVFPTDHDESTRSLFCRYCGYMTPSQQTMQDHLWFSNHRVCGKFRPCPYCQRFDFTSQLLFNQHVSQCLVNGVVHVPPTVKVPDGGQEQTSSSLQVEDSHRDGVQELKPEEQVVVQEDGKTVQRHADEKPPVSEAVGHTVHGDSERTACPNIPDRTVLDPSKDLGSSVSALTAQEGSERLGCLNVTGQTAEGAREMSVSSRVPGLTVAKPGEESVFSSIVGQETKENPAGKNYCNNGKVVKQKQEQNSTSRCGSPKHVTFSSKEGKPFRTDVSRATPRLVWQKPSWEPERPMPALTMLPRLNSREVMLERPASATAVWPRSRFEELTDSYMSILPRLGSDEFMESQDPAMAMRPRSGSLELMDTAESYVAILPRLDSDELIERPAISPQVASVPSGKTDCPVRLKEDLSAEDIKTPISQPEPEVVYHCCHLCELMYSSADKLSLHLANKHRVEKTVKACEFCEMKGVKKVLSKKNLRKHLVRKHNLTLQRAEAISCGSTNNGQKTASSPQEVVGPDPAGSSRCSTDASESSARSATEEASPVKQLRVFDGEQQEYVCAKCVFSSLSREEFCSHIRAHAKDSSVQCLECGLCFASTSSLSKHLFKVHKVKRPAEYISEHNIKLPELPAHIQCQMNKLPSLRASEAGVFHKDLHRSSVSQVQVERRPAEEKNFNSMFLTCNVCYRDFANETLLKAHLRSHGMAFICSRRALKQRFGGNGPNTSQNAERRDSENHQNASPSSLQSERSVR